MQKHLPRLLLLIPLLFSACQVPMAPSPAPALLPTAEASRTPTTAPTATDLPTSAPSATSTPTAVEPALYTSERWGVQFQLPEGFEPVGEDQFAGESGFIQIEPYKSPANYVSRACDWEANLHPERYGLRPQLTLHSWFPEFVIGSCTLIPSPDAADATVQIFFRSFRMNDEPKLAVLRTDPQSAAVIQNSFTIVMPEGDAPEPEPSLRLSRSDIPFAGPETQVVSEFTFSRWQGPQEKLDELRMNSLSTVPQPDADTDLAEHNAILARFGYRLQKRPGTDPIGQIRYDLYRGEQLMQEDLGFWLWPVTVSENDFAVVMEGKVNTNRFFLIRKDSIDTWNGDVLDRHFWQPIVFVGEKLAEVVKETDGSTTRAIVKLDGEPVYTYSSSMYDYERTLVRSFDSWDGHWVMNANNTLIIDGEIINAKLGYGEVFDWQIFEGKPWFFFEKDGRYGISYGGEELPVTWEHIPHLECCGGWHNPTGPWMRGDHDAITFFGWEDGAYSFFEVRK